MFMCVCSTFRPSDFFTIRQKRIRGGSTFAECNSGQRDPAIVSLPRLARPGDTIDSAAGQTPHTVYIELFGEGRQTGREGDAEGARQGGGWEGGREGGREGEREGGREGGRGREEE